MLVNSSSLATTPVYYPRSESITDERLNYYVALAKLCLEKSGEAYQLTATQFHPQQERSLRLLELGHGVDLAWTFTTLERERKLRPIRIPIDRGLIGWRLFLIKESNQSLFTSVRTAAHLSRLRAGQGHDWPDMDILKANNFFVSGSATYEGLFNMLTRDHIQYFPRALIEIWPELNSHADQKLLVEPRLALHYPTALYFFVNKRNTKLATDIERGLQLAIEDGSFKKLFLENFGNAIHKAELSQRIIININNPTLPPETPLSNSSYWFSPQEGY